MELALLAVLIGGGVLGYALHWFVCELEHSDLARQVEEARRVRDVALFERERRDRG